MLVVLGSGLWIGLSLLGVAVVAMQFFTERPVGDAMVLTIWGSTTSWTLTALPLFLWMGEILFRSRLAEGMFRGLAPWLNRLLYHAMVRPACWGWFYPPLGVSLLAVARRR